MDGGYINEGGQLKTKNGQKYIVNDQPDGIFISKACAILSGIIALLAIIVMILLTYFLLASPKPESCSSDTNRTIAAAGIFGVSSYNSDTGTEEFLSDEETKVLNKEIVLYDGWNPQIYRLLIEPNINSSTNNGTISIDVVKDPRIKGIQPIVLDINNIIITDVRVIYTYKSEHDIDIETSYGDYNETFIIKFPSGLKESDNISLTVRLDFTSQLSDTLQGFYKTSFENVYTGETEWVTSTQFSPIDARRAFPCFDRPDKKAQFLISIVREQDKMMTLSNMPSAHTSFHRPGYIREDFQPTPQISTYLIGFVISNLVPSNHSEYDKNISPGVEIWTRPEVTHMTKYAYRLTRQLLPFYERYFGIPYKLPKIDLVTIPDFGFSAMENWGLLTFRDAALLVPEGEEQSSSAAHTEYVATILAHELAHQWFGNLVTPKWWNDLWLKEGFATYMSYLAVNQIEPNWEILKTFPIHEFQQSMQKDSDKSSHPISFPVTNAIDIRRIFDPISYSKGAILLRMVNGFLGDNAFTSSIRDYLKQFSYSNAVQDDLWKIMTHYGHKFNTLSEHLNIKDIMDSWTTQPGYPVVNVKRSEKSIMLTQQRYTLPALNPNDKSKWFIPITFETDDNKPLDEIPSHWMTNQNEHIIIDNVFATTNNSVNWLYLNMNRRGYYRVNYDYPSWIILKQRFKELPQIIRSQLLDDSMHLARAEYLTYDVPLTFLLELMSSVDDSLFWATATENLVYITHMLNREPAYETFRAFMRHVVLPAYNKHGLNQTVADSDNHINLMHRARVIDFACKFHYDRCTNAAHLKYRKWMAAPTQNVINPNFKETIYCTALQEGNFHEWYFAYNRYKQTNSASEKEQILSALGCTTRPWLLSKYLNMTIDPKSGIRKQDSARAFAAVAKNIIGYEIAFDFLVTNIKEISEYFGDGFSTLSKMIDSVTTYMNKEYQLEQLNKFAMKSRKLGLKSIERSIQLATEQVKNNIHWRSRSYYNLKQFLEDIVKEYDMHLY